MLAVTSTRRFLKDSKLANRRGLDLSKLETVIALLANEQQLPVRLRDHALGGDWAGYRDCHIEPDWLLIYKVDPQRLYLARTGTHADLFSK